MLTITTLLLVVAFVLFLLVAFNVASRINLLALGLALWVLAEILTHGGILLR